MLRSSTRILARSTTLAAAPLRQPFRTVGIRVVQTRAVPLAAMAGGLAIATLAAGRTVSAESDPLFALAKAEARWKLETMRHAVGYPRTDSVADDIDKTEVTLTYNGTAADLRRTGDALAGLAGFPLKALGTKDAIVTVVKLLAEEDIFKQLGLECVDAIVIQRMGKHVLRINRIAGEAGTPSSPVPVGAYKRCAFLELNDIRARALDAANAAKSHLFTYLVVGAVALGPVIVQGLISSVKALGWFAGKPPATT